MAFLGSVLKQGVSKHISASNPSIYQSLRCMSSSKIFSGGLPWGLDESGLRDTFSQYDAKVIIDREMNRSRRFATSASTEEASSAVQAIPSRKKSWIKQLPIRRMGDNKKSLNSKSLQAFKHPKYTNKIAAFKTLPAVRPSLNYSVMQFHYDPLFRIPLAPGPSNAAQGIQCRMKTTTYIARLSRSFLLPFGDVFSKDKVREKLLGQFIQKCFNLMGKDPKVMELIEKCSPRIRLIKGIEMMMEIILKNRKILPSGYNSYLNKVSKMRSLLSNRTNTNTLIESVKIPSVYQRASLIAQDIAVQLKRKRSFRSIFSQIVRKIPRKGIEGIRIRCKGRLQGAEMAKTECGKYGKTSTNSVHKKIDYAFAEVPTRYGMVGVKVWISYSGDFGGGSAPLESGSAGNDDYANRS